MSTDQPSNPIHQTNAAGAVDGIDAESMRFLAGLQQRISAVAAQSAELSQRERALADRERELASRAEDVAGRGRELEAREATLAARSVHVEDRARAAAQEAQRAAESLAEIARAENELAALRETTLAGARAEGARIERAAREEAEETLARATRERRDADAAAAKAATALAALADREESCIERERVATETARAGAARLETAERAERAAAERLARAEQLEAAAVERERSVAQREAAAAASARAAAEAEGVAAGERALLERKVAELHTAKSAFERQRDELERTRTELDGRAREVDRREQTASAREKQARSAMEELERRRAAVNASEVQAAQLEATSRHLREQAEQIKSASERQVASWQDRATEAQFQAESALAQVSKLSEQLAAAQARARSLEEELDQVKVLGVTLSPEAQGRVEALTRRAESAEQRAATLQEIVDQHTDEVAKAESRFDALERQLHQAQAAASSNGESLNTQLAAWREKTERMSADLASARAAAVEASDRVTTAERAAEASARAAADGAERIAWLERELERRSRPSDEHGTGAALLARIEELEAQVEREQRERREMAAEIDATRSAQRDGAAGGFEADQRRRLEAELAQREETLAVLGQRLLNSEERNASMQMQLDRIADGPTMAAGEQGVVHMSDLRRDRLRKMRSALAQEHRKVLLAKEALGRHKAEADAVLAQRARLAQMAQSLKSAELEAEKTRAKSSAGTVIIAAVMTLVAVSGIGYLGAGVLWPSAYAARATLAAVSDGRAPSEEQNKQWTAAHERLVTDPQVLTLAAEKFGQRGMRDLSNPASVADRFAGGLAVLNDVPGLVTLELRGIGREATARELETFVGAVSAVANSRRDMRADGLSTSVAKPAEAGNDPLDDTRRLAMLGAVGVGMAAAWGAGFAVYRLLARPRKTTATAEELDQPVQLGRLVPNKPSNAAA